MRAAAVIGAIVLLLGGCGMLDKVVRKDPEAQPILGVACLAVAAVLTVWVLTT